MPSAKNPGRNLVVMSMTITPMAREPAPIRKIPPIPWKLESLLTAGQYELIDKTNAASRVSPPISGRIP